LTSLEWHSNGSWKGWNLGEVPPNLIPTSQSFLLIINGSTPVHLQQQDCRGWGSSGYSVKEGYKLLLNQSQLPEKSNIWKEIWNIDGLPKINIFGWKLAHNKLLTGENMLKRGIMGPFRCALCKQDSESSTHLFLDCNFSKQVLQMVYSELMHKIAWPSTCRVMIGKWSKVYKGSFSNKPTFLRVWKASIKFVCWKIWLARNKVIFKNKMSPPPPQSLPM
jgi:hypothetical protein